MFVSDTFSVLQQRIFYSILNGVYPESVISRMNNFTLKKFVSSLLLHTADVVGASDPAEKKQNYILWLSNKYENVASNGKKIKETSRVLNFRVILNIVNFFRQNPIVQKSLNFNRFVCKKNQKVVCNQKTLKSCTIRKKSAKLKNDAALKERERELVIRLCDVTKYGEVYQKECFMKYFYLKKSDSLTNGNGIKHLPHETHNIKLYHCPKIPISSDLGQKLMSKEKLCLTEETKLRRINRVEWYLSQPVKKLPDVKYIVTYKPTKQIEKSTIAKSKIQSALDVCSPMTVKLPRMSLAAMKNKSSNNKSMSLVKVKKEILARKKELMVHVKRLK